jgi:hypothetical protein
MMSLDEIAAHLGVTRIGDESDESLRRRLDRAIALSERQGSMPIAAPTLTAVQQAIKDTVLAATANRDDVPLEEIIRLFGTPAGELRETLPAIIRIVQPVLRRLVLDGQITVRPDDRPRGKRPEGVVDPLEGLRFLVSRKGATVVAPKTTDEIDLLHNPTANVAYIRCARLSYDRITSGITAGTITRTPAGSGFAVDLDTTGHLVGIRVMNATTRFTAETLATATII